MNDELRRKLEALSEEELQQVTRLIEGAPETVVDGFLAKKEAVRIETLTAEFRAKFLAAPRGWKGNTARKELKDHYRAQGVPVHTVDFTGA